MYGEPALTNDLNRIFIPCRSIIGFEILTSLFLATSNYEKIKDLPSTNPGSNEIIELYSMRGHVAQENIIDFFINGILTRLKPIVMYARKHHDRFRMGNVSSTIQTRKCLFFALHKTIVVKCLRDIR